MIDSAMPTFLTINLTPLWVGVYGFLALFLVVSRARGVSVPVALLVAALFCKLFLPGPYLGPFSLGVNLMVLLLGWVGAKAVFHRRGIFRNKETLLLFVVYLLFVAWATINRLYNGEPVSKVAHAVASTHLYAAAAFLVTQNVLEHRRDSELFAGFIALTAVASGFVGIMQWFGVKWFWDLGLILHPGEKAARKLLGIRFGAWGYVPGLASFSIPFSYHLITFGMFVLSWSAIKLQTRGHMKKNTLGIVGTVILSAAVLLTQSRSALLAVIVVLPLLIWHGRYLQAQLSPPRVELVRLLIVPVIVLATFTFSLTQSAYFADPNPKAGGGRYSLNRIFVLKDLRRVAVTKASIEFSSKSLIVGGGQAGFKKFLEKSDYLRLTKRTIEPHNMFLNAVVFYGIPGVILMVLLLSVVVITCKDAMGLIVDPVTGWIALGAILGLAAYVVNGQFHNNSFVMGGMWPWWLLGLLCSLIAQEREHGLMDRMRQET
jgi:hypothetical protein